MKTDDFVKQAKALGYRTINDNARIRVYEPEACGEEYFLSVRINLENCLSIYSDCTNPNNPNLKTMLDLGIKLAFTPVGEREEEPQFYVRVSPKNRINDPVYVDADGDTYEADNTFELSDYFKFTPRKYCDFLSQHAEWKPFLKPYDAENTDVFVPAKDGDEE